PAARADFTAAQPEPESEARGESPSLPVRLHRLVPNRSWRPDFKSDLFAPGIHQPQLGNSGRGIEWRQPDQVLADGALAHDLDDEVGRAFQLHEAVGPFLRRDLADSAALEGVPEDHHHVGLDGEIRPGARNPAAVHVDTPQTPPADKKLEDGGDLGFHAPVGIELLGAHIHLELAGKEIDPASLGEIVRAGPLAKTGQVMGRRRYVERVVEPPLSSLHRWVLSIVFTLAHLPRPRTP